MKKYDVSLSGVFNKEYVIEAESQKEAESKAKEKLDKDIGISNDDYVIDSITTIPEF